MRRGATGFASSGFGAAAAACLCGLQPGAEAAQVAVDALAVGADRGLERLDRDRQPAAAGDDAEHHRIDERAGAPRDRVHVDQDVALRILLDRLARGVPES